MLISILASSLSINSVSLDASNAGSSVLVVILTILILDLTHGLVVEDVALVAG